MENYLHEAFQAFKALDEDVFPATQDGEEALRKFLDGDDLDDVQVIIDADAEDETELKNSYVGDVILKCPVCQSMTYKEQDKVDIDAEKGLANVEETCPYCQSEGGFEIVGQVAEYCPECAHEDRDAPEDFEEKDGAEVEVEEKAELTEDLHGDIFDTLKEVLKVLSKEGIDTRRSDVLNYAWSVVDYIDAVEGDYSVKQWLADTKANYPEDLEQFKVEEKLTESVEEVKVETSDDVITVKPEGDGKVEVKTEPKAEGKATEVIAPVTDEVEAKLTADDDETFEDEAIDEFDEESFDELEEKYLKGIYENVDSYKTTKGSMEGDKIILEGVITFTSGKQKKTTTIFESHTITKKGKVRFLGENLNITKSKKAFVLTGNINGKKLISESLTYNYGIKDESGKSQRLYGTVSKSLKESLKEANLTLQDKKEIYKGMLKAQRYIEAPDEDVPTWEEFSEFLKEDPQTLLNYLEVPLEDWEDYDVPKRVVIDTLNIIDKLQKAYPDFPFKRSKYITDPRKPLK